MIEKPADTFWDYRTALVPPAPVRVVGAAGGLVVAAGDALHHLRPGDRRVRSRELPRDFGAIAVAVEPWFPFRVAIASHARVSVYAGPEPDDPVLDLHLSGPEHDATHLAWVRHDGVSMLYLRQRGGQVTRLRMEGVSEIVTTPHASAIAADAGGVLSLITLVPDDEAAVWILPEGAKEWDVRPMTTIPVGEDAAEWLVHLAVKGSAVAYSMDDWTAHVSWRQHEDDSKHFEMPPAVFQGPIAFQADDAIFTAYNVEGQVNVLHHVRHGTVTRIARFGLDDDWEGTPATVTAIAWDEARRALWVASPELGLIELTEPGTAPRAKELLN